MADDPAQTGTTEPAPTTTPENPGGESKTFTQEQVNDLIAKEKGKIQGRYADYDDVKSKAAKLDEIEQQNATELDKAQGKLTKAEERAITAETKLLRFEVATEKEVPAKLVPLLTATDKEGLEAQADLILENAKAEPTPEFDGGAREPAPAATTPDADHNKLAVALFGGTQKT